MNDFISITQIKSKIGIIKKHKLILLGLGLRYIGHTVFRKNTKSLQGMINKVIYMLKINN
ncbi:50S ribosomal protein L30 [Buchnera aphidicola]|uniref:50S ribosomal protein L30 n=1 Tax=Buchnera aphidicola TaxID=9 RepID=UPI0031B83FAE